MPKCEIVPLHILLCLICQVAELKDKSKRRFAPHNMGVNGCVFITFPDGAWHGVMCLMRHPFVCLIFQ